MTVRQMNQLYTGTSRQTRPMYASPQVQSWARGLEIHTGRQRRVISEQRTTLPLFSARGVRWDVLIVALTLIALLFLGILCADLGALFSGGDRIGKLSDGIASLESSNSLLREQLSLAMLHPVLLSKAESMNPDLSELPVILATIPET